MANDRRNRMKRKEDVELKKMIVDYQGGTLDNQWFSRQENAQRNYQCTGN